MANCGRIVRDSAMVTMESLCKLNLVDIFYHSRLGQHVSQSWSWVHLGPHFGGRRCHRTHRGQRLLERSTVASCRMSAFIMMYKVGQIPEHGRMLWSWSVETGVNNWPLILHIVYARLINDNVNGVSYCCY